jgi:transcriptional regulator with XRE-family HTH domain
VGNKTKKEEGALSYKSLGRFVHQKRKGLGYDSADKFAEANPGVTASYVKHIEAGDGSFGSPETFTGLARALGVTPGQMLDILVDFRDFDGNLLQTNNTITLPANFTEEDKKLISDLISFLGYRKRLITKHTRTAPLSPPPPLEFPYASTEASKENVAGFDQQIEEANPNPAPLEPLEPLEDVEEPEDAETPEDAEEPGDIESK